MKITYVMFKTPARTVAAQSQTGGLDHTNFPIEAFAHPILGPMVRYVGSPWAIPAENIGCIALEEEPKPEAKAKK